MAYKTGGYKTKYIEECEYIHNEYTIYCAVESVSDICCYQMSNEKGEFRNITIVAEDDTNDFGCYSLIDCLHQLKMKKDKTYKDRPEHDIIINEMTNEEMKKIFGR